jgi:hypothetical protein
VAQLQVCVQRLRHEVARCGSPACLALARVRRALKLHLVVQQPAVAPATAPAIGGGGVLGAQVAVGDEELRARALPAAIAALLYTRADAAPLSQTERSASVAPLPRVLGTVALQTALTVHKQLLAVPTASAAPTTVPVGAAGESAAAEPDPVAAAGELAPVGAAGDPDPVTTAAASKVPVGCVLQ